MEPVITVGLDGSPESLSAARWAADEAERRNLTLRLLHAWPMLAPEPTKVPSEIDQNYWANRLVHNAQAELQRRQPGLAIVGNLVADEARDALPHAASESETTVLGSRGLELVESCFLGDISMSVVARAERPVVLVRAESRAQAPPAAPGGTGDAVLALKLHGPCDGPLGFAFAEASARNVPLRAVHGRSLPVHAYVPWRADHDVAEGITQDARKQLDQVLHLWLEKYPRVGVADNIGLESPARAVLRSAGSAGLLIIGRRRHRRIPAPRPGPVAQAAIPHARRPVAVVPHD
ncbi:universal stress protein [Streptomyces sp. NPDC005774]|uniref:universal stress protein n=1 Tax=Streptomyces sp. NPDC005774 TaxID=3364728 RepID=UPI00369A73DF